MVLTVANKSVQKWKQLFGERGELSELELRCIFCGGFYISQDHWKFMADMPQDPVDVIDDIVKMGLYKPQCHQDCPNFRTPVPPSP